MAKDPSPKFADVLRPSHLPPIRLHRPKCVGQLLDHLGNGATPLAGGTDIMVWASHRGSPDHLAWTGGITDLNCVDVAREKIHIGATATLAAISRRADVRLAAPGLVDGASVIGSVQLRHQATLVGNVCTASPGGDTLPALYVHNARLKTINLDGRGCSHAIDDFITGPGQTSLAAAEVVTGIELQSVRAREGSAFKRFTQRNALDLAVASVAVRVRLCEKRNVISAAQIALGAVGPTIIRADSAASQLIGQDVDDLALQSASEEAALLAQPISDHRASADYRRQLIRALVMDVTTLAIQRATERTS